MDLVNGRYRIVRPCGAGGMGTVFEAMDEKTERPVAIKVLSIADDEAFTARFRDETRIAQSLSHPHLVKVLDAGIDDKFGHYIVFEYLDGKSLTEHLAKGRRLSLAEAVELFGRGLCSAVDRLHDEGVIHRDIKPENILSDGAGTFKLSDLGLCLFAGREAKTATGQIVGTPGYLAVEAFSKSSKEFSASFDVYGIAAVFIHAMTGKPPFSGRDAIEIVKQQLKGVGVSELSKRGVKPSVARVLASALDRDPMKRPTRAGELLAQLLEADREVAAGGQTILVKGVPAQKTRSKFITILVFVVLMSSTLLATLWMGSKGKAGSVHSNKPNETILEVAKLKEQTNGLLNNECHYDTKRVIEFFDDYVAFNKTHRELGGITLMRTAGDLSENISDKGLSAAFKALTDVSLGRGSSAEKKLRQALLELRQQQRAKKNGNEESLLELDRYFCNHLKRIQMERMKNGDIEALSRANDDVTAALSYSINIPIGIDFSRRRLVNEHRLFLYEWLTALDRLSSDRQLCEVKGSSLKDLNESILALSKFDVSNLYYDQGNVGQMCNDYKKVLWRIVVLSDLVKKTLDHRQNIGFKLNECVRILTGRDVGTVLMTKKWNSFPSRDFFCTLCLVQLREFVRCSLDNRASTHYGAADRAIGMLLDFFRFYENMYPKNCARTVRLISRNLREESCLQYVLKGAVKEIEGDFASAAIEYEKALKKLLDKPVSYKNGLHNCGLFSPVRIAVRRWILLEKLGKLSEAEDEFEMFKEELPTWQAKGVRLFGYDRLQMQHFLKMKIKQE